MTSKGKSPTAFMLAGPNGAGKSTLYYTVIEPKIKAPFINADLIQKNELQDQSMQGAYDAAKIAEQRRQEHLKDGKSFISESTFSHESKLKLIDEAKDNGFRVIMYHVNVRNADLSVARVENRVKEGGHNVPEEKIRARYERNQALIKQAVLKADYAFVYDNSELNKAPKLSIAMKDGQVTNVGENVPKWAKELYKTELSPHLNVEQSSTEKSLDKIKKLALGIDSKSTVTEATNNSVYTGRIVGETAEHKLQRIDDKTYVTHNKSKLGKSSEIGQSVKVDYDAQGDVKVSALPGKRKEDNNCERVIKSHTK